MDKKADILQDLRRTGCSVICPRPAPDSECGFAYPDLRSVFPSSPGEEIPHLERLADEGYLEREFSDRILLCPFCSRFAISVREACPRCSSPRTEPDPGRTSPRGRCQACGQAYEHPVYSCLCIPCGRTFPAEKAHVKTLYAYRPTAQARAPSPFAPVPVSVRVSFADVFLDTRVMVYSQRFFDETLARESVRAARHRRPLSLLLIEPDAANEFAARFGRDAAISRLRTIAESIKGALRATDIPALVDRETLALLLPETPLKGARIVSDRIRMRAHDLNTVGEVLKLVLSLGLAGLEEDGTGSPDLMAAARKWLQEAHAAGGDCVRPG